MKLIGNKTKLFATMALAVALVFSMSVSAFAVPEGDASSYAVSNISAGFLRTSSTSATGEITADTFSTAEYIKAKVTLQEWVSSGVFRDVSGQTQTRTVYDTSGILFVNYWTLKNNTAYRLKVVVEDKKGSTVYTNTFYSNIE